ncbi:MAG: tetratricopeptide repeat protein [Gammaproteobacteria bacterium]|nr:MAG: tetratricopeptide repeat protein [Gammaproteobacteria bacterium]
MTNRLSYLFWKWSALSSALLITIILSGCEGGNESGPAVAQAPMQQSVPSPHPEIMSGSSQIEMLKAALFDDPENHQLLAALGDAYFEAQRYQEAISVYEKAIKIDSNDADTLNDLGLAYYYTGNSDTALTTLAKATSGVPDYKNAWLSTGFILTSLGRYDEAVTPLKKARELDPNGTIGMEADNFLKRIEQLKAQAVGEG